MPYKNIEDEQRYAREYYLKNQEKLLERARERRADPEYRKREAERKRERRADPEHREQCNQASKKSHAFEKLHFPWILHWRAARQRCNDPNSQNYKYYGGKGIQMLLSKEDTRRLYIRDQAWSLKKPSLDRIDSNSDYHIDNCQLIEQSENSKRRKK